MQNYCSRIHHGLTLSNITNTGISYSPCCWMPPLVRDKVIDWHHPQLLNLRSLNQNNKLTPACNTCQWLETSGQQSQRQGYGITHGTPTFDSSIQYLDINIDYTCNLACVSCGPEYSTTWRNELGIKHTNVRPNIESFINIIDTLDLGSLKEVRFWGGEPFLTHTWKKILEYIVKKHNASKIKLMFNTNGSCIIDNESKALIEQFKFARISFSIDAIGKKFEYIRYPASWDQVNQNLMWWKTHLPHNAMLALTVTASVMNVLYLDEILAYSKENFSVSAHGDPVEIFIHPAFGVTSLTNMPLAMAQHVKSLQNYYPTWIQKLPSLGANKDGSQIFVDYIRSVDQRRNFYLYDALPEVAQFFNYSAVSLPSLAKSL